MLETRLFEANEELSSLRAKAELTKRMVDYVRETGFASGIIPT